MCGINQGACKGDQISLKQRYETDKRLRNKHTNSEAKRKGEIKSFESDIAKKTPIKELRKDQIKPKEKD